VELGSRDARPNQRSLAGLVNTVDREDVFGEIDSDVENSHDFPFRAS
jgi:hypothetical protein